MITDLKRVERRRDVCEPPLEVGREGALVQLERDTLLGVADRVGVILPVGAALRLVAVERVGLVLSSLGLGIWTFPDTNYRSTRSFYLWNIAFLPVGGGVFPLLPAQKPRTGHFLF